MSDTQERRNIPTCVGKTQAVTHRRDDGKEHPHVRGENHGPRLARRGHAGTSPRAWGKRGQVRREPVAVRNIPTCVGKTRSESLPICACPEHPHVRGEKIMGMIGIENLDGTSPRAWGKRRPSRPAS